MLVEMEFRVLDFEERRKPENTKKETSDKSENQQQTQPTHGPEAESNPRHIGERGSLSPPRHPCSHFSLHIKTFTVPVE